jgi:hypothetical protein
MCTTGNGAPLVLMNGSLTRFAGRGLGPELV